METNGHDDVAIIRRELQLALGVRDDLIAAISHEVRTPLTIVTGLSDVLARHAEHLDAGSLRLFADRIAHHAGRLETMVDDLLDASRRDTLRPSRRHVVVREVVELARRDLEVEHLSVTGSTDAVVHVDGNHVVRVLAQLLTNAMAYGRSPVTITVGQHDDVVTLIVRDDGEGVPGSLRDRLFDPFTQRDAGDRRTSRGVGIGLHVARELARANGGELELLPDDGLPGACFRLTLPRGAAPALAAEAPRWPQDEEAFQLFSVLSEPVVVHDSEHVRYANAGFLELLGRTSPAEVVGRRVDELVHDPVAMVDALERLAAARPDAPPPSVRIPLRHADGHAVWVVATRRIARVGPTDQVVVHVRPTTAPASTDALVAAMAAEHIDTPTHLRALLDVAHGLVGTDVAFVGRVQGETCVVDLVQPPTPQLPEGSSWPVHATLCGAALGTDPVGPVVVRDMAASAWADHPARTVLGVQAFATAPVMVGARPWGTVLLARTSPAPEWGQDAVHVVQLLASWVSGRVARDGQG